MRLISVACLGLLACVQPPPAGESVIRDALLAQWQGPGGCLDLDRVHPLAVPFFANVRFYEARCLLEHGDTAVSTIAVDDALVYVLDNRSSYQLLVDRHPATGVDSASAVTFAALVARFTGRLMLPAQIVKSIADLPDSLQHVITAAGWELTRSGPIDVDDSNRVRRVVFTAFDQWAVLVYDVILSPKGEGTLMVDTVWTEDGGVRR
jgi:hypothetical protein